MGISWREFLGLLVGLAICYGVISYAVTLSSQDRELASGQAQEKTREGETGQQTTPADSDEDTKTVTVRVTGSNGESFGANYGNLRSGRTVEGVVPADYEVQVRTDPSSGDHVSATVWKPTGSSKELKVQILDNGRVLREWTTSKEHDAASVRWDPNDPQQQGGTTTPGTQKAGKDSSGSQP